MSEDRVVTLEKKIDEYKRLKNLSSVGNNISKIVEEQGLHYGIGVAENALKVESVYLGGSQLLVLHPDVAKKAIEESTIRYKEELKEIENELFR